MPKRIWRLWEHYCKVEEAQMGVGEGEPCNWCGEEEPEPKYKGRFWMYPAKTVSYTHLTLPTKA